MSLSLSLPTKDVVTSHARVTGKNGEGAGAPPMSDIQKVVTVFKLCQGVDQNDKAWDKIYFGRFAKPAKELIVLLGSWRAAGDCIQDVYEKLTGKGLTVTLETVIKHATEWRRDNAEKQGGQHGVFAVQGDGDR